MIIFLKLFCCSIVSLFPPEIDVPSDNHLCDLLSISLVTLHKQELILVIQVQSRVYGDLGCIPYSLRPIAEWCVEWNSG